MAINNIGAIRDDQKCQPRTKNYSTNLRICSTKVLVDHPTKLKRLLYQWAP